jgi:hypothetical protein
MQLSDLGKRSTTIWERMREIEGELFLLSARSVELDFEDGHQFERLYRERTHLAGELLLNRNEHLPRSVETPAKVVDGMPWV